MFAENAIVGDMSSAEEIQRVVRVALAERNLSQAALAEKLNTHASTLSRILGESNPISQRSLWPRILEELDLEVVVRPKRERTSGPTPRED